MTPTSLKVVPATIKARVNAKIAECIAKINARYGVNMRPVNVAYDINSSRLSGQADYTERKVRFNPAFLSLYTERYLTTTVPHEIAHIAVYDIHGDDASAHGYEWQMMMGVVGAPANRCHSYETPAGVTLGKPKMKFHYKCKGCGEDIFVGPKIHAGILKGAKRWHTSCGKFRGALEYVTPVGKVSYQEAERVIAVPKSVKTPIPAPKAVAEPQPGGSKYDRCLAIYKSHPGMSRAALITMFMNQVDMTAAGASTYHSKCKAAC